MMSLRPVRLNRLIPSPVVPVLCNQDLLQSNALYLTVPSAHTIQMHGLVDAPSNNLDLQVGMTGE